jgi:hypothetical protein
LGERNWRDAARNGDSWQKLLRRPWLRKGCCANDDDDDDVSAPPRALEGGHVEL